MLNSRFATECNMACNMAVQRPNPLPHNGKRPPKGSRSEVN